MDELRIQLEEAEASIEKFQDWGESAQKEMNEKENKVSVANATIISLTNQLAEAEAEAKKLTNKGDAVDKTVNELTLKLREAESTSETLKDENTRLEKEVRRYNENNADFRDCN